MKLSSDVCVLGGCGAMGRVIVNCLSRLDRKMRVTVADRQEPHGRFPPRVRFAKVDLQNRAALVRVLRGHSLVINSTSHHWNLPVMRAALEARIHYLDLGGLFHFTRRQLKLGGAFHKKGLLAILGMGCAPGISNLLARWAAEGMDSVEAIHIKVGGRSWGKPLAGMPYAVGTLREELTLKPAVIRAGRWRFEKPRSGAEQFAFPSPVGLQKIFRTLHSEIATFPASFPGVREASFKIGFSPELIRAVLKRADGPPPFSVSGEEGGELPRDCEITWALVRGRVRGKRTVRAASCAAFSSRDHTAGDWDTAWPPALAAQMILRGEIQASGVFPPEAVVPWPLFFQRLKRHAGFRLARRVYS